MRYRHKRTGKTVSAEPGSRHQRQLDAHRAWQPVDAQPERAEAPAESPAEAAVVPPKPHAPKVHWVDYAVTQGLDRDEADAMTKAGLIEALGG